MLSRLISLLSRIPAVKWAFNRLRPLPHSGSIDVAQIAADESPAVLAVAEAAPVLDGAGPLHRNADIEVVTPIAEDTAAISVPVESLSAAPTETIVSDDSSVETPAEVEPVTVEEVSISSIETESEPVDAPELVSSDLPAELLTDVEPEAVDEALVTSVEAEAVEAPEALSSSEPSPEFPADVEPVVEELVFIALVETETVSVEPSEFVTEDEPVSVASMEIELIVANDLQPVAAVAAEETIADAPVVAPHIEPVSPAPKSSSTPKPRAKAVEPADRAALIRQRWTETGIRMWNPRLHGTGEATLNIQGRIGLLPPEPGETMPRYDKLEFRMLGGQIACEGVIVEAPVHAGQRSFTRLAEPRSADRSREPVRERQAALA